MRISMQCGECVRRSDVKVGFDAAGEFSDYYDDGEVLDDHPHERVQQIQEKPGQVEK